MSTYGLLPPGECAQCDEYRANGWGPAHYAMSSCRSGGYNHCTCDTCF